MSVLGRRHIRADGLEKVTGQGRYTADLVMPGMLHASFLYADRPHARITKLDTSAASALPGVLAVATHEDVPDRLYGTLLKDRRLFAKDVVRFVGEIVAGVAALTPEIADEALGLIRVEYEDLEPVLDPIAALEPESPLVHPDWESYGGPPPVIRKGNDCGFATIVKGDVEQGFAEADEILEERYVADTSHPVPIEPHAVVAQWQGSKVTIWSTTQVPFAARDGVAECLDVPVSAVRVVVPHLGGGFGGKCDLHFEAHVAALARKSGRPVRLVLDRREEFTTTDMIRHAITTDVKVGVKRDGTITALKARLYLDTGAYSGHGPIASDIATMIAAGPYRVPNILIESSCVYTNKAPSGSTRAPTGPQICWAIEQHMDVAAARIGLDSVAFRLKNVVEEGDEGPTGQRFDPNGMRECVEKAAELIGWDKPRAEGEGIGISCGWWFSLPLPSGAFVTLNTDGTATVVTGAQENGSGAVMGLALIAAEELGLEPEQIFIHYQDTDSGLRDLGSAGSQTTFNVGRALVAAAGEVRDQLLAMAAEELEASPGDLELANGQVRAKDAPSKAVSIKDLACKANDHGRLILGRGSPAPPPHPKNNAAGAGCVGRLIFPAFAAPTFFCHAARVRVDRETGVVRVLEVAAAHDFGRVINPIGAEGQVEGGIAHSLGMAFTEGTIWVDGHQMNPHLLDYKLQTAADLPKVQVAFVEKPAVNAGPYGIKGVGEPPVVPTAGAVANAIAAATGSRVRQLPMTPYRVWEALQ